MHCCMEIGTTYFWSTTLYSVVMYKITKTKNIKYDRSRILTYEPNLWNFYGKYYSKNYLLNSTVPKR